MRRVRPTVRVVTTAAVCAVTLLATSCTDDSDPGGDPPAPSGAVPSAEIDPHEAGPGSPTGYGIEVPDGAVQIGPLIRQQTPDLLPSTAADGGVAAPDPDTEDAPDGSDEPDEGADADETPPYTTALLRIDDAEPGVVIEELLTDIADSLSDTDLDPTAWAEGCAVSREVYTGCRYEIDGTSEDGEALHVILTVDAGDVSTSTAAPGSLGRPVMTLTLERRVDESATTPPERTAPTDDDAAAAGATTPPRGPDRDQTGDATDDPTGDPTGDETGGTDEPAPVLASWPDLESEQPSEAGDTILTRSWRLLPSMTVILSGYDPGFALTSIEPGADADAIAARYVARFADPGTTPKVDRYEDLNQVTTTYAPRNDGTGPRVSATSIASGRGNYVMLVFEPRD